jgi:hypothetical protein
MNNKVTKRVLIWLFFGMILTAVPITAAAVMGLPKNASIVNFFELVFNQDLLAVAFTLSAAASADVIFSREGKDGGLLKVGMGSLTMVLAFVSAIGCAIVKSGDERFDPFQTACAVAFFMSVR